MNIIWSVVILLSCLIMLFRSAEIVLLSFLTGAQNGVDLALSLLPIYLVWSGIINVMEDSGLSKRVAKILSPVTNRLFKGESEETKRYITLNFTANLLGAGSAGTPLGIKAVRLMQKDKKTIAPHSVLFTIINTTSIQLVPTTIISLLIKNGANNPYDIVLPSIIVSTFSTVIAILIYSIIYKK